MAKYLHHLLSYDESSGDFTDLFAPSQTFMIQSSRLIYTLLIRVLSGAHVHEEREHTGRSRISHAHTLQQFGKLLWLYAHTHTHVHTPQLWYLNKSRLDTFTSVPQFSVVIMYRTFSFVISFTCLCISRILRGCVASCLTSQHCLLLLEPQLPLSWPICQSVAQALSPFTGSLHWSEMPIHKKMKRKKKRKTTRISNWEKQKQLNRGALTVILGSV